MKFIKTHINDVHIIEPEPHEDSRGMLRRHFCRREFRDNGLMTDIKQCNVSENNSKHTLRGFHYQLPPHEEVKTITCLQGAFYDVIVDLRRDSESFLKWMSFELKEEDNLSLYIPSGFANSYLTLEDSTTVLYYMSEFYFPGSYAGFRYSDPLFSVKWPAEPSIISEKDLNLEDFNPDSI